MSQNTPVSVVGASKTFCQIASGFTHTHTIDKNGIIWGWGRNTTGQIGDNTTTNKLTPVSILGQTKTFCKIDTGQCHTVAIDKNGRAWGWGNNNFGQTGDNSTTQRNTPVSVLGATKTFCEISSGQYFTIAIDKDGRAWSWGQNNYGQLGDNTLLTKRTPVSVVGTTKTFCKISAGQGITLGIDKNGRVWSWGYNDFGQLGDGTVISKRTPVSIGGATKTFCKIQTGTLAYHVVALDKNGQVWTWGYNLLGALGDNSTISRCTPVSVAGAKKTFCEIACNTMHSLAIDKYGKVWAWGRNNYGELGIGAPTFNKCTPTAISGVNKTFCKISAGYCFSVAIDKYGKAWGWGISNVVIGAEEIEGVLGNNAGRKITPVRICNI